VIQQEPYQLSENIHTCKLGREDLVELLRTIKEGFPDQENTVVSISIGLSDVDIEEKSIETFLQHPNLPREIDKLNIHVYERNSKTVDAYRWVALSFYDNLKLNYFNVKGEEKNWVIGTHKILYDFFQKRRIRFSFLRN
jgi:hypothetical protein